MTRIQFFTAAAVCFSLGLGTFAFLYRVELLVAYHRQGLAVEIKRWQTPPPLGKSKDYRKYSGVDFHLSSLVALRALDRVELKMRLYSEGAISPLPSLSRIENGKNPAPVFYHIKGDPRTQPQTVIIWCEPSDTSLWERFADSTVDSNAVISNSPTNPSVSLSGGDRIE